MKEEIQILELAPNENIVNIYGWEFNIIEMLNFDFGESYTAHGTQFTYIDSYFPVKEIPFHVIYVGNGNFYVNEGSVIRQVIIKKTW